MKEFRKIESFEFSFIYEVMLIYDSGYVFKNKRIGIGFILNFNIV